MRNRERYGKDWKKRARAAKEAVDNKCTKCGWENGVERWSDWTQRYWPVWLQAHHKNFDPENPNAELIIVCPRCHWRYYRRPGERPPWLVELLKQRIQQAKA